MTELVTFGETPLRFSPPGSQRLRVAREMKLYADGMSSNVAITANELGAEVLWISRLPETPLGKRVTSQVSEHGVETAVTWTQEDTHRQGLVFQEAGASPRASKRWHDRRETAFAYASPSDFPMERIQSADILFTDLCSAVSSKQAAETTQALLRAGSGSGALTAVDLNYAVEHTTASSYRGVFEALTAEIDVVFADESDVRDVLDRTGGARELANVLAADYDLEFAVIARSNGGAVALENSPGTNVIHEREAIDAETVDPTGARAAFIGGFLEEHLRGADTARSLSVAVASAALARTIDGPYFMTTAGELEPIVDEVIDRSK